RLPAGVVERFPTNLRARALQQRWLKTWLGPLGELFDGVACERGLLVVSLTAGRCRSRALVALAASEAWQWVETVLLTSLRDEEIPGLADSPLLVSICALTVSGEVGPPGAQALGGMRWLAGLARLDLSQNRPGDQGLQRLLASPNLDRLRCLELGG